MEIQTGIEPAARERIAEALSRLLADSYTLYLKTHNFHWNVKGPHFAALHTMFETQYTDLAMAVDEIAERIRALGAYAPGSYTEFTALATVKDATGRPDWAAMVRELTEDHETLVRVGREVFALAAEAGDESSAALVSDRLRIHEKTAWMLRETVS